MRENLIERYRCDKAQVQRARHGQMRFRLEFAAAYMQIDLLIAEAKRDTPGAEGLQLHLHDLRVELRRGFCIGAGQHQMVEMVDHEETPFVSQRARACTRILRAFTRATYNVSVPQTASIAKPNPATDGHAPFCQNQPPHEPSTLEPR